MYLIDTNVLMDFPQVIEDLYPIFITTDVLKELDGLKMSINPDIAFKARRAAVVISRNLDKINWDMSLESSGDKVDDKLICIAKRDNLTLVTNDVYLKVKSIIKGVSNKGYGGGDEYAGIRYWDIDCEDGHSKELEDAIQEHKIPCCLENLNENEYVIARNKNSVITRKNGEKTYEFLHSFVYRNNVFQPLTNNYKKRCIKNSWINSIFPKNDEQACLFEALNNKDISIIYAGGKFGTGKSFILNNYALQELENGNIKKIIYVPNNAFTENTIEIGSLPGELLDKTIGQIGPLVDLVGVDHITKMISYEQLEVVPMSFIRGRSFSDSIVIVNEAQNLTEDHIKLLIARCGEGTRIFFDGDYKQADSHIFRNKNGLKLLMNLRKSPIFSKIFAAVNLVTTERSFTAQASDYLDNCLGNI